MIGRIAAVLFRITCALVVVRCVCSLAKDGSFGVDLAAAVFLLVGSFLLYARPPGASGEILSAPRGERSGPVLRALPEEARGRIERLAASGDAIGAIKVLRETANLNLRAAKGKRSSDPTFSDLTP